MRRKGFTLIEMLVVIAIISILATVVLATINDARKRAIYVRAVSEMRQIEPALYFYKEDHSQQFPADVNRSLPPGLETYLNNPVAAGAWPDAPFQDSVYDWDNWEAGDLSFPPYEHVYQISIRFCDIGGANCNFPDYDWVAGFDQYSALYYCIEGPCRSHASKPVDHPGYCVNC